MTTSEREAVTAGQYDLAIAQDVELHRDQMLAGLLHLHLLC